MTFDSTGFPMTLKVRRKILKKTAKKTRAKKRNVDKVLRWPVLGDPMYEPLLDEPCEYVPRTTIQTF